MSQIVYQVEFNSCNGNIVRWSPLNKSPPPPPPPMDIRLRTIITPLEQKQIIVDGLIFAPLRLTESLTINVILCKAFSTLVVYSYTLNSNRWSHWRKACAYFLILAQFSHESVYLLINWSNCVTIKIHKVECRYLFGGKDSSDVMWPLGACEAMFVTGNLIDRQDFIRNFLTARIFLQFLHLIITKFCKC